MASSPIAALERLLGTARDGPLLRYSLGLEYLKAGDPATAVAMLREALARDPRYTAAWKALGRALETAGRGEEAREAYERGIATARERGDRQAEKEMSVFLRRLARHSP